MPKVSQTIAENRVRSILAGIAKRVPARGTVQIEGKRLSRAQIAATYQAYLDALQAARVARIALRVAVAKERATAKRLPAATQSLRAYLTAQFGLTAEVLADFGSTVPKVPGPKTAAAKALGAERLRATRKARRTMGKRQRAKVKGGEG